MYFIYQLYPYISCSINNKQSQIIFRQLRTAIEMIEKNEKQRTNELWSKAQALVGDETIKPRIIVAGKTGVGKSSILNALLKNNVYETGVLPTTRKNNEEIWGTDNGDIIVIDAPGLGEAEAPNINTEYDENIKQLGELNAHILLLILKCDDRALKLEKDFIDSWNNSSLLRKLPVIIVINQIDKMKPVRIWEPDKLNLKTPQKEKEKNIRSYIDYVSSLNVFEEYSMKKRIIPISSGESFNDPEQYGIKNLKETIYKTLPDAAKTIFSRAAELKKKEAHRITNNYSRGVAAAVGGNFLPGSDALVIAPIQIAMIVHLGKLHNVNVTKSTATGFLASAGMSFTGRFIAQELLSFMPIFKNIIGPPLAFGLTYSLGTGVNEFLGNGKIEATEKEFRNIVKNHTVETEKAVDKFKSQ